MLQPGHAAPDFTTRDQNHQEVTLSSYRGGRCVLLVFYPLAFSGICSGELAAIQAGLGDFQNERVQVLTVSVDSHFAHKVWQQREGFGFPLLADFWPHGAIASSYGVFDETRGVAGRGTFLVDRAGIIRYAALTPIGEPRDPAAWREALAEHG
ncbi:peroxiredoxin [Longispora albida]|uniref:peroxiredoxin n=1 Tax=Longispora albida TaxID=203523 RepID=UPI000363470A|nr:peroxiredoxin [Longispora albida]